MRLLIKILIIALCVLVGCESKDLQPTSALASIYLSSTISQQKPTIGSTTFATFRLSYSNMNYSYLDAHLKIDSIFTKTSLVGPDLMELNYYYSFFEAEIDSTGLPNGSYANLNFEITPCQWPEVIQGMHGKSIHFAGNLAGTRYDYWHNGNVGMKLNFPDSLLTITKGVPVKLEIYVDLDKALDPQSGGVDLSRAVDGNQDGIIAIDPTNAMVC